MLFYLSFRGVMRSTGAYGVCSAPYGNCNLLRNRTICILVVNVNGIREGCILKINT